MDKVEFEQIEILLVCHGAGHNDTICVVERKAVNPQLLLLDYSGFHLREESLLNVGQDLILPYE